MEIRSVTGFLDAKESVDEKQFAFVSKIVHEVKLAIESSGHHVQSTRMATQPFSKFVDPLNQDKTIVIAKELEAVAKVNDVDYLALGPVTLDTPVYGLDRIVDILSNTDSVFLSMEVADFNNRVSIDKARRMAQIIKEVSQISPDGFKNLFLTTIANVQPWSPFLPSAYHGGGKPAIAIAIENAALSFDAISGSVSLIAVRENMIDGINLLASSLSHCVEQVLARYSGITFKGFDFSYAPYPEDNRSIGGALEILGVSPFGGHGSLFASAFLTETLERANYLRTGFNGLMLAVLEDSVIAKRVTEGLLTISELLSYSAVCGTGLDLIALPGEVHDAVITGMLLDVSALALRLNKQLTARIMPIPGAGVGDPVEFDFEYFSPSIVMPYMNTTLSSIIDASSIIDIRTRK